MDKYQSRMEALEALAVRQVPKARAAYAHARHMTMQRAQAEGFIQSALLAPDVAYSLGLPPLPPGVYHVCHVPGPRLIARATAAGLPLAQALHDTLALYNDAPDTWN